jgi:hypothetical protein
VLSVYVFIILFLTFRPYKLIKSLAKEALYYKAYITNIYNKIANPKKHKTSAFIKVILYSYIFITYKSFIINS